MEGEVDMEIKLVFGDEFWDRLDELSKNANNRIFLLSAYIGKKDWNKIYSSKKSNIPVVTMCRSDSTFIPPKDTFIIDHNLYHGKLYVVDNVVLLGSQNLYNANKDGEFSVEFCTENERGASLIAYQALLKTLENSSPKPEPVNSAFLEFYEDCCPFCGGMPADPYEIISCAEYGGGFVSREDCDSYGGEGACKYCIEENRTSLGECYVCDHSGCGFGIQINTGHLIYHEFVQHNPSSIENAKKYLQLFNYFAQQNPNLAVTFFKLMGFTGNIFNIPKERLSWSV